MDGNGRWALSRGLPRTDGHAAGEEVTLSVVYAALDVGIPWLTLFTFSTENWNRPESEVAYLMQLHRDVIKRHGLRLHQDGVRIRYMGTPDRRIPSWLADDINRIQRMTAGNIRMTLTFAFSFGGRAELVEVCRRVLRQGILPDDMNEGTFAAHLPYPDMPDVDLVIRTANEHRLSNFMLWRCAYAELIFMDVLWPEFSRQHFDEALRIFANRKRRFGTL